MDNFWRPHRRVFMRNPHQVQTLENFMISLIKYYQCIQIRVFQGVLILVL